MNKMILTIFESEDRAYEGLSAIKQLHDSGDLTLYAFTIIAKDNDGSIWTIPVENAGPLGKPLEMFAGGLMSLLSGSSGALEEIGNVLGVEGEAGTSFDSGSGNMDYNLAKEVSKSMKPGFVMVVVDVDETWITPMNTKMDQLGGQVFRKLRYETADYQFIVEIDTCREALRSLKQEVKRSPESDRFKLDEQIDLLERRIGTLMRRTEDKLHRTQGEIDYKLEKLSQQLKESAGEKKEKIIQNIHKLKAEFAEQKSKMDEAIDHAKQALFPM